MLLAGDHTVDVAPESAKPAEEQAPPVAEPDEARDIQVAARAPQEGAGKNDVGLAPQLGGDGLESLAILTKQGGDVGETLVGLLHLGPTPHGLAIGVGLPVLHEVQERELRPLDDGGFNVIVHIDHPIRDEVRDVLLAGEPLELELAHDEQADPLLEEFVLEDRPSGVFDCSTGLLDGGDEPDDEVENTAGDGQIFTLLLLGHFGLLILVADTVPTLCRQSAYHVADRVVSVFF